MAKDKLLGRLVSIGKGKITNISANSGDGLSPLFPESALRTPGGVGDRGILNQSFRAGLSAITAPQIVAAIPPSNSQTALSVGLPVKNLETLELTESEALAPKINSPMPTARSASPIALFIKVLLFERVLIAVT